MNRKLLHFIVIAVIFLPSLIYGQWAVGPHILVSIPQSKFANVSNTGGGIGIKGFYRFESLGGFALRADFGFITYDSRLEAEQTVIGPIFTETRDESYRITFGPQFALGKGKIKINLLGMGGFYIYRTSNAFRSKDTTAELGWNLGGGIQYDIGLGPWLDLAVEYHTINNIPGQPDPDDPEERVDIDANDISLKIGVVFFLGD